MKSIIVSANSEDPGPVVDFVQEELSGYECTSKALYQIEVAIEEIFVNIARYAGLGSDEGVEVRCEVIDDPLRMVLQFLDRGVPFNPLAKPDPDVTPEALIARVGGLGIFMVKQMMDEVTYAHEDGKNVLTLVKSLT